VKISLIVALASNHVIGKDNTMPWHLPEDLRYFKRITLNKPVVMGRNTFESIGKPLPQRSNIIISRNTSYQPAGVTVVHSLEEALQKGQEMLRWLDPGNNELMIIGGAQIYDQALPLAVRLYLTEVHAELEGDAFFPAFNRKEWHEVAREDHAACERNPLDYSFIVLDQAKH
jgi:dihydrofolate reductase